MLLGEIMALALNNQFKNINSLGYQENAIPAGTLEKAIKLQEAKVQEEARKAFTSKFKGSKKIASNEQKNEAFLNLKDMPKTILLEIIKESLAIRGLEDKFKNFTNYQLKDKGKYSYVVAGNKAEKDLKEEDVIVAKNLAFRPIAQGQEYFERENSNSLNKQPFADLKEYELRSLEDFDHQAPVKKFSFTGAKGGLDKSKNSLNLTPTTQLKITDELVFYWTENSVEHKNSQQVNFIEKHQNEHKAQALHHFTRIANKEMVGIYFDKWDSQKVVEVLEKVGIDTSKSFYVNGKKFWLNEKSGELNWVPEIIKRKDHSKLNAMT